MRISPDWRAAMATAAAIVGAGFASGREVMTFFSEMGGASWLGVAVACGLIGLLTALVAHFSVRTGARSFPAIFGAVMGKPCEDAVHLLHGLLMLITAAVMLSAGAELGRLTLPLRLSGPMGLALTMAAGALCARGSGLFRVGGALAIGVTAFYLAMACDARPVDASPYIHTAHASFASAPLAALLGLLYAALNVSLSGSVIAQNAITPRKTGLYTAILIAVMLLPANAAMLRFRDALEFLAMPTVVLAARWGTAGFYLCAGVMWLAIVSTLAAALASLAAQFPARPALMAPVLAAATLIALSGFDVLVRVLYPMLGWVCALALAALSVFYERPRVKFSPGGGRD